MVTSTASASLRAFGFSISAISLRDLFSRPSLNWINSEYALIQWRTSSGCLLAGSSPSRRAVWSTARSAASSASGLSPMGSTAAMLSTLRHAPPRRRLGSEDSVNQRAAGTRLLAGLVATLVAVCGFVVAALITSAPVATGNELPLSTMEALAAAGRVETAVIHNVDHIVTGLYLPAPKTTATQYWAAYPPSDAEPPVLIDRLATGGATVSVDPQAWKSTLLCLAAYVAPVVLVAGALAIVLLIRGGARWPAALRIRRTRRGGAKGHHARAITFAAAAAADGPIEQLQEVVEFLRNPSRFAALGAAPPRGVLLHGPAGCGKGLLALAIAGEARARFFATSGGEVVASVDRGPADSPRDVFALARAAAPAVVFIAEVDAVAGRPTNPDHAGV